jgi:hypothetical protein
VSRPSERREEQRAGERIERRVNDGPEADAERAEREPWRRLPTDAVNNVVLAVARGAISDLAHTSRSFRPSMRAWALSG